MSGIHHITAIAGKPARNLDFYTRTLGLRFIKRTVNFDDPGTYHFYYGDETGHPGTILTFFPWEHAAAGVAGSGLTHETAFRVPTESIGYWVHRLVEKGVPHQPIKKRFGQSVIEFNDPDGLGLALVGVEGADREPAWSGGGIPAEHAIRGFAGATLISGNAPATTAILTDVLGFTEAGRENGIVRLRAGEGVGGIVDVRASEGLRPGRWGRGSVHHIAFRARDDAEQAEMARKLLEGHGVRSTEQRDRQYFRSIYFREPGGVLFEIATDEPGFAIDEPVSSLGTKLKLPPFLEPRRKEIEAVLPDLEVAA